MPSGEMSTGANWWRRVVTEGGIMGLLTAPPRASATVLQLECS